MSPARRRGPRAAFVVLAVAILAAAVVVALGFRTSNPSVPGIPRGADLVTVTGQPISRPVKPGFVGLSLEYTSVLHYAGDDPTAIDPVFVHLVQALAPGGHVSLRIGGDTTDWGWYPVPGMPHPRGIRFSLSPEFVAVTRALAQQTGARLILGLNLEADSVPLLAAEVHALSGVGRPALAAFEIGNEPEVFGAIGWYQTAPHHPVYARRHNYGFAAYSREFTRFGRLVPQSVPLAGPASGGAKWWAKTKRFLAAQPRVKIVTYHLYPLARCMVNPRGPYSPTIAHLLSPASSTGLAESIAPYVPVAHRAGAQVRIDELDGVACGGAPGVTDRFADSLWTIDTLFALAQEGVDGVNFHTFTRAYYRPFYVREHDGAWSAHVAAPYYGMLAFNRVAPPGSTLLRTGATKTTNVRVWATRGADHRVRVALLNTSPRRARTIAIKLPHAPSGSGVTLERLQAPSLSSAGGITLGGQAFADPTTTGSLSGHQTILHPQQVRPGIYVLRLPAGSAALLTD